MKIETKYNLGDWVWFMYRNKPRRAQIVGICIRPNTLIFYRFRVGVIEISKRQKDVYATQEELL